MTPTVNITIQQGADYDTPIPFFDDAGDPEDFTGCTAVAQIAIEYDTPSVLTLSTADGSFTIEDGQITPHIRYATTAALLQGAYVGDILIRHANGLIRKARNLIVMVCPTVTQVQPPIPSPPPPSPSGTQVQSGDGTIITFGDGTDTTWSS